MKDGDFLPYGHGACWARAFLRGFTAYGNVFSARPPEWNLCRSFEQDRLNLQQDFLRSYFIVRSSNLDRGAGLATVKNEKMRSEREEDSV